MKFLKSVFLSVTLLNLTTGFSNDVHTPAAETQHAAPAPMHLQQHMMHTRERLDQSIQQRPYVI